MDKDKIIMYAPDGELQDSVQASGVLDISDLSRKQTKLLAKTAAGWTGEDGTFSWQDVASGQADIQGKTPRQEKRFKRIFNKQLSENLSPALERQYKQELLNRMKSGDASAMSQWTTDGINKFGYQFMPVMLTAATLPFGIGGFGQAVNTIGLLPAVGAEIGSWGLGYGGYKLGSYLDDDFGTKWIAPTMSIAGGFGGYGAGYKGMVKAGSKGWLPKGDAFMYGSQFVGDVAADGLKRGIRTTPKVSTIDRSVGMQNRIFTWDPIFTKTTWQTPAFNTNGAYGSTGQSQIRGHNVTSYAGWRKDFDDWRFFHNNQPNTDPITMADIEGYINYLASKPNKSIYESNLIKNFNSYKFDLLQDDTYYRALSPEAVLKEFRLMGADEIPISSNTYPDVSTFFKYDALPRLLESFKRNGIVLQPDDIDYITKLYSNPFDGVDIAIGYAKPGSGGYSQGTSFIRFSNRYNLFPETINEATIVHELHHSLRDRLANYLTSKGYFINPGLDWLPDILESGDAIRNSSIRNNYLPSELEIMKPLAMDRMYTWDKTPVAEIGAVSAGDARFNYWKQTKRTLGRVPTVEEINKMLDEIPSQTLYFNYQSLPYGNQIGSLQTNAFMALENEAYRRAYLTNAVRNSWYNKLPWYKKLFVKRPNPTYPNWYKEKQLHENSMGDAWRDAMKHIAGISAITAGVNGITDESQNDTE